MVKIAPSILSVDFTDVKSVINMLDEWGVEMVHLDVMDGHFVPPITFGADLLKNIRDITDMTLDCHLMVTNPAEQIPLFLDAGADYITFHIETTHHPHRLMENIKDNGCKCGISLNPITPIVSVENLFPFLDLILVMSVNPGYGGQRFIEPVMKKIERLWKLKMDMNSDMLIQVDGGVNEGNIEDVADAGADVIVVGSSIFSSGEPRSKYDEFLKLANR